MQIDIMPEVNLPENLLNAGLRLVSNGACLDCGRACSVYTDTPTAVRDGDPVGETVVVHTGAMCRGFRNRFTPSPKRPKPSPACDMTGQLVERPDRAVRGKHRLDTPVDDKPGDKK